MTGEAGNNVGADLSYEWHHEVTQASETEETKSMTVSCTGSSANGTNGGPYTVYQFWYSSGW